jgi:hypothetical protein
MMQCGKEVGAADDLDVGARPIRLNLVDYILNPNHKEKDECA